MNIGIICCNTAYLNEEIRNYQNLKIIELSTRIKEEEYKTGEISQENYFKKLEELRILPQTSQPSAHEIQEKILELKDMDHIFIITPNRYFSGTYQNITLQVNDLKMNDKVTIIDSESVTICEGVLVEKIIKMVNENKKVEEIKEELIKLRESMTTILFPGDLKYLKNSGRLNEGQYVIGRLLNFKLFVKVINGKAELVGKGRGIGSILKFIDQEINNLKANNCYFGEVLVPQETKEKVLSFLRSKNINVQIMDGEDIVASSHFGPNTFGVVIF